MNHLSRITVLAASRKRKEGGFAMIVTLSLMILLTVIAVGLLTLSSISLRASSQSMDMQAAKSNARMALMLPITCFSMTGSSPPSGAIPQPLETLVRP